MPDDSSLYDLPWVTIRRVAVTDMDNNVYLVTSKDSGAQVLIDAAGGIRKIHRLLEASAHDASERTRLSLIITTHSHHDHIRALRELVDETGVRTAAGASDASAITGQTGIKPDVLLKNRDIVAVEGFDLSVIHLRGHTPGSVALAYVPGDGPHTSSRATRCSREVSGTPTTTRTGSRPCSTTSPRASSTCTATTPSYIPATANPRRSATSARTSRSAAARLVSSDLDDRLVTRPDHPPTGDSPECWRQSSSSSWVA